MENENKHIELPSGPAGRGRLLIYIFFAFVLLGHFYYIAKPAFRELTELMLTAHWVIMILAVSFTTVSTVDCLIVREKTLSWIYNIWFQTILTIYVVFIVLPYMNNYSLFALVGKNAASQFGLLNLVIIWTMLILLLLNTVGPLFSAKPEIKNKPTTS